ncbi:MAG: cell division protein FtsQ/DivIB [Acidiferrobacteraceae bacterium]
MTRAAVQDWISPPRTKLRRFAIPYRALFAGALAAAAFGTLHYLASPARFPVRQVVLEGDFARVDRKALDAAIRPALTGNFFRLDLAAVAARAETVPWVYHAVVTRAWPFRVDVAFTVQHPVARWSGGGWLNEDGARVHLGPAHPPSGLPLLSGPAGTEARVYHRFGELSQMLGRYGLALTTLSLSARGGWRLTTAGGMTIVMGHAPLTPRLERFLEFRTRIMAGHRRVPERVDLRYGNGFAVQWGKPAAGEQKS